MPVRFRCGGCHKTLSVSRRKVGTTIECPLCRQPQTVPSAPEVADEVADWLSAAAPGAKLTAAPVATAAPPGPPPVARRAAPATKKPVDPESLPLFEREDFEKLLGPAKAAANEDPLPLPDEQPKPEAVPHSDAIVISRGVAIAVVIAGLLLVGLAFAAGFLVGGK